MCRCKNSSLCRGIGGVRSGRLPGGRNICKRGTFLRSRAWLPGVPVGLGVERLWIEVGAYARASEASAAAIVASTSCSVCAPEMNAASNCAGGQ